MHHDLFAQGGGDDLEAVGQGRENVAADVAAAMGIPVEVFRQRYKERARKAIQDFVQKEGTDIHVSLPASIATS